MVVAGQDTFRSVMMLLPMSFDWDCCCCCCCFFLFCCWRAAAAFVNTFFASGQGADAYIQSWPGQCVRVCERHKHTSARVNKTVPLSEYDVRVALLALRVSASTGQDNKKKERTANAYKHTGTNGLDVVVVVVVHNNLSQKLPW